MGDVCEQEVWCHTCDRNKVAFWDSNIGEFVCIECGGNFVEAVNQGIESFLVSNTSQPNTTINESEVDSIGESPPQINTTPIFLNALPLINSDIIQHIVECLLEIPASSSTVPIPSIMEPIRIRGIRGTPVGIVVQQNDFEVPRNLMGLLQTIANVRYHSLNPDPNALDNTRFEQFLHHILMNESSHAGAPPASADVIAFLQREMVTAESVERMQGECCISQESFEIGDVIISLNCRHKFKEEPITHWLKMHSTCPVCRITI